MSQKNKFYITTTLPYVNSDPHIGFAMEIIQADAIARFKRLQGFDVLFNTGTDEHGLKIYRKAQERGVTPQEYCDEYAAKFDALKGILNLTYTNFIRTTNNNHIKACHEFWKRCADNGDIYKKNYKVKYCVGCELEKTESELEDGKCPVHPNLNIELIEEENYFFKFSKYQDSLLKLYNDNPTFVRPSHRLTEIRKFTERGLQDFSISRLKEKMPWGVPVPGDDGHVMYVWFDALVNYLSTLGWPEEKYTEWWPGVQIAGTDNLRQQSNMWQAMLMSAGVKPSSEIIIHGFITAEGKKMSKSLGNVVDPFTITDEFGTDALRYYLLREIPFGNDGDFNKKLFIERYNSGLANNLGNLVNRIYSLVSRNEIVDFTFDEYSEVYKEKTDKTWEKYVANMNEYNLHEAIFHIWKLIDFANKMMENEKPWALIKENKEKGKAVLCNLLEVLRHISIMVSPIIPEAAIKIRRQIGLSAEIDIKKENGWGVAVNWRSLGEQEILFPRIEI